MDTNIDTTIEHRTNNNKSRRAQRLLFVCVPGRTVTAECSDATESTDTDDSHTDGSRSYFASDTGREQRSNASAVSRRRIFSGAVSRRGIDSGTDRNGRSRNYRSSYPSCSDNADVRSDGQCHNTSADQQSRNYQSTYRRHKYSVSDRSVDADLSIVRRRCGNRRTEQGSFLIGRSYVFRIQYRINVVRSVSQLRRVPIL